MNPATIPRVCYAAYMRMLMAFAGLLKRAAAWLDRNRVAGPGALTQLLSGPAARLIDRIERSNDRLSRRN